MTRSRLVLALAGCGLLGAVLGCAFAADLLNSDMLIQLGFDPATIVPESGKAIVAFTNNAGEQATCYVSVSSDPSDAMADVRSVPIEADVGQTASVVFDCPIGVVTPGAPGTESSSGGTTAVIVTDAAGTVTEVAYAGAPLVSGVDFLCGDVIEIRVISLGGGTADQAQANYVLRVQVHPGR
jgi:hypothetical protein